MVAEGAAHQNVSGEETQRVKGATGALQYQFRRLPSSIAEIALLSFQTKMGKVADHREKFGRSDRFADVHLKARS